MNDIKNIPGIRFHDRITVTPKTWSESYQKHHKQRNTERHAESLERMYEQEGFMPASFVRDFVSYRLNGVWYKANGHSRGLLMDQKKVSLPNTFFVDRYIADNQKAADAFFDTFDTAAQVHTGGDYFYGLLNSVGITPQSKILQRGGQSGIKPFLPFMEHNGEDLEGFVKKNPAVLHRLDDLLVDRKARSGVIGTMVWSLYWSMNSKNELPVIKVTDFWKAYLSYRKDTVCSTQDAFFRLAEWVRGHGLHAAKGIRLEFAAAALAVIAHTRDKVVTLKPATDKLVPDQYVKLLEQLRERHGNPRYYHLPREKAKGPGMRGKRLDLVD